MIGVIIAFNVSQWHGKINQIWNNFWEHTKDNLEKKWEKKEVLYLGINLYPQVGPIFWDEALKSCWKIDGASEHNQTSRTDKRKAYLIIWKN